MLIIDSIPEYIENFIDAAISDKWLIYIAIFLMVIDFFISTDIPTFISYVLLTIVIFRHLPGNIFVRLTVSVFVFFAFVFLYYFAWGRIKVFLIDKVFAKDKMKTGMDSLIGEIGEIRIIDGVQAAKIHGDIYPLFEPVPYGDGTHFTVIGVNGGTIIPDFSDSTNNE